MDFYKIMNSLLCFFGRCFSFEKSLAKNEAQTANHLTTMREFLQEKNLEKKNLSKEQFTFHQFPKVFIKYNRAGE